MKSIQKIELFTYLAILILILIGLYFSIKDKILFSTQYVVEDGLIEWLTVIGLVIGSGVCFRRIVRLRTTKSCSFLTMVLLLGLLYLFAAGEEISWGQRIFGFQSSSWFKQHNAQQEINLHNLVVDGKKINKIVFSTGLTIVLILYLLLLPVLYRQYKKIATLIDRLAIPIPSAHHIIAFAIFAGIIELAIDSSKRHEIMEFSSVYVFLLITAFPRNKSIFAFQENVN